MLLHTLYEQAVKRGIKVYDEYAVTRLAAEDDRCHGVIAYDMKRGRFETLGLEVLRIRHGRLRPDVSQLDQCVDQHRQRHRHGA